jgi:hypothetical protein
MLFLVVVLGVVLPWVWRSPSVIAGTKPERETAKPSPDGYVGSAVCASCHEDIYRSFTHTDMGRSMTPITPALIQTLSLPGSFTSTTLDRHYEVSSDHGKLYQSEWQADAAGKEVFRNAHEMGWIIGAGASGYGALLQRGSYLFEAPLSYYTKPQQWKLSPGYESVDIGFNRPVLADCIFCHSGRPSPVPQNAGKFGEPPFSQLAIGCENCHGPGAAHIHVVRAHADELKGPQIVNPSTLSADLQNNICMSCHEGADSRIPRPGKSYLDFRPGTPLDNTLSILMIPLKRDSPDDSDHVNHYVQMSMSRCNIASAGQLRCTTCHDPHVEPTHEEAPAYFNAKCMSCHASRGCTLSVEERHKTMPIDNCIGCHMPRRDVSEIAHDSLTNHRIPARPNEPWPEEAYQQTTADLPDLVHLDRVPGRPDDLPAITLLKAYKQISLHNPEYRASYLKVLAQLEQSDPNNADVQLELGYRDLREKSVDKAIGHLRRSIELDPDVAFAYAYLSEALQQNHQTDDAIAAIEKAVTLEPYNASLQRALVGTLIAGKQYKKAHAAAEHYLELFPEDPAIRKVLARIDTLQ